MLTVAEYTEVILDALKKIPDAYVESQHVQQDIADPIWNGVNSITLITGELIPINTLAKQKPIGYSTNIIVRIISETKEKAAELARIAAAATRAAIPKNTFTDGQIAIARVSDQNASPFGWRISMGFNLHVKDSI
jgi:hypothetical protein